MAPSKRKLKLLVLTSRYTATRDIISEDFGRQTRLFSAMRKLGHDIDFYVADYRKKENKNTILNGINVMIRPFSLMKVSRFVKELNKTIKSKDYDYVIGTSDPLWGAIGYFISKRTKKKFVYDLHDNYKTYASYSIPFFGIIDKKVILKSDIVTTVSNSLKDYIKPIRTKKVFTIENGFDERVFKPMDKEKCRKNFNFSKDAKIIAYTGSIQRLQGIDVLLDAFETIKKKEKKALLAIAGRFYGNEKKYIDLDRKGVKFLGSINQEEVAKLINACDVAIVPNSKNEFTKYAFPYKIVEYLGCGANVVATKVGDVEDVMSYCKECLCRPNDAKDMAEKIDLALKKRKIAPKSHYEKYTWENIAKKSDKILISN